VTVFAAKQADQQGITATFKTSMQQTVFLFDVGRKERAGDCKKNQFYLTCSDWVRKKCKRRTANETANAENVCRLKSSLQKT